MQSSTSIIFGTIIGIVASVVLGLIYIRILQEPGAAFYPFAALYFLGGPVLGGLVAAFKSERKVRAFLASSGGTLAGWL